MLTEHLLQDPLRLPRNPNGGNMKKLNTKKLVATALMIAIVILLDVTGIGYFNIGPLSLTLMCVPVIIGTLTLGHIEKFNAERAAAGIDSDTVSPMLLPKYNKERLF